MKININKYLYFNSKWLVFSEIFLEVKQEFKWDKIRANSIISNNYINKTFEYIGNIIPTKILKVWKKMYVNISLFIKFEAL